MARYFKLVSLNNPQWILDEFLEGRVRFGWSPANSDLRRIQCKDPSTRTDQERVTWSYTKFLLERIVPGDRVVVQPEQPIERFVIGEVIQPGYSSTPGTLEDFNHVLHVSPLSLTPIPINAKDVTESLKHDLSKRGHRYEIYPETSLRTLDALVEWAGTPKLDLTAVRADNDTLDRTVQSVRQKIATELSEQWRAKNFEKLCATLCNSIDYIEVKEQRDRGRGWDLLLRIINPVTQTILLDDVPVQCKNFTGAVTTTTPVDDLERCIRNSATSIAFLFILGDLTEEFLAAFRQRQEILQRELERPIIFELVDQDRIADLYVNYMKLNS